MNRILYYFTLLQKINQRKNIYNKLILYMYITWCNNPAAIRAFKVVTLELKKISI